MKKIMSLMLGLSMLAGVVAFSQEKTTKSTNSKGTKGTKATSTKRKPYKMTSSGSNK
jgi:hypothetical protein